MHYVVIRAWLICSIIVVYSIAQIALGRVGGAPGEGVERLLRRRPRARARAAVRDLPGGEHRRGIHDWRDRARLSRRDRRACGGSGRPGSGRSSSRLSVGPRIRRLAAEHDLRTVGRLPRVALRPPRARDHGAAALWIGTVCILAGQLLGIAWILTVVIGHSEDRRLRAGRGSSSRPISPPAG